MQERNGQYQICGPTAFNFYGFDDQVPSVTYVYNNRISGNRTIGSLEFQFTKVADKRLGAVKIIKAQNGGEIIYSSRARALMDAVYDWSRFNSLPRGYVWIRQEINRDPELLLKLVEVTDRFGNQATIRRIGYLLDALSQTSEIIERLLRQLSNSRSLIPWIPVKAARGRVNQRWGLIIND
jgi:predicted transcriptional regulator of viral defense system